MAGSELPPLTNIPYCCLPWESGPCLSTSVGGHPLRSPSHRRLGGPLPRQLANDTHAHLNPINIRTLDNAILCFYAVLIRTSSGYPPD